jgi:hypothetical protein
MFASTRIIDRGNQESNETLRLYRWIEAHTSAIRLETTPRAITLSELFEEVGFGSVNLAAIGGPKPHQAADRTIELCLYLCALREPARAGRSQVMSSATAAQLVPTSKNLPRSRRGCLDPAARTSG